MRKIPTVYISASDATHERFGREEGAPMVLLSGEQSEQLQALEDEYESDEAMRFGPRSYTPQQRLVIDRAVAARSPKPERRQVQTAAGQLIEVRDAFGQTLQRIALGPVDPGYEFAVVWAATPEEWESAQVEGREPEATPWPIEDVHVVEREPA
jgi:hypothetical protein